MKVEVIGTREAHDKYMCTTEGRACPRIACVHQLLVEGTAQACDHGHPYALLSRPNWEKMEGKWRAREAHDQTVAYKCTTGKVARVLA